MLYTTENWMTLRMRKLQSFSQEAIIYTPIMKRPTHFIDNFPNPALIWQFMMKLGEIPLSLKAYRIVLNYWYRLTKLSDETLVKTALPENTLLRTNWIMSIEKLINVFNLTNLSGNLAQFKTKANKNITDKVIRFGRDIKRMKIPLECNSIIKLKCNFLMMITWTYQTFLSGKL